MAIRSSRLLFRYERLPGRTETFESRGRMRLTSLELVDGR
jgi:hypothetical protein